MREASFGEVGVTRRDLDYEGRGVGARWFVTIVIMLPLVYVLSIGPVLKMDIARVVPQRVMEAVYWPLIRLSMQRGRCDRLLRWYVWNVWRVPMMVD